MPLWYVVFFPVIVSFADKCSLALDSLPLLSTHHQWVGRLWTRLINMISPSLMVDTRRVRSGNLLILLLLLPIALVRTNKPVRELNLALAIRIKDLEMPIVVGVPTKTTIILADRIGIQLLEVRA